MEWIKGQGTIIYDPPRPGLKKNTKWWCVVSVDRELTRYYRYFVSQNPTIFGTTKFRVLPPAWDAHISIIRGEVIDPELRYLWKKYDREEIEFEYLPEIQITKPNPKKQRLNDRDDFFFLPVRSEKMSRLRDELGKGYYPEFHVTVGKLENAT
tara:strand:- start:2522 stop:2980 length:459 start_codon:yes stop_codon:yes gene_type:complete